MKVRQLLKSFQARDVLTYDPIEGRLIWKAKIPGCGGKQAGSVRRRKQKGKYYTAYVVNIQSRQYNCGHVAWCMMAGYYPQGKLIYKDGDCANIRSDNLIFNGQSLDRIIGAKK